MMIQHTSVSIEELARRCNLDVRGTNEALSQQIDGAGPLETAENGQIAFLDNPKYVKYLADTKATAVICQERYLEQVPKHVVALLSERPYDSYALVMAELYPTAVRPLPITSIPGISDRAFVSPEAQIEEDVTIEFGACIGAGVSIGAGSVVLPGAVIGQGVQIGRKTTVGANSTVLQALVGDNVIIHNGVNIGQDGFGFAMGPRGHIKIPQFGRVIIQDNVEIGAGTAIDRGANRDTIIGEGTKIDNQVQVGHNTVIGRHCVIVGQVGISGSAKLGDFVVVAGKSGVAGHIEIGDGAQVGGGTAVLSNVDAGESVMGIPAISASSWMRQAAKIMLADRKEKAAKKKKQND